MFSWQDALILFGTLNLFALLGTSWWAVRNYFRNAPVDVDVEVVEDLYDAEEPNLHVINDQLADAFGSFRSNFDGDHEWSDEEPTTVVEVKKSLRPLEGWKYANPADALRPNDRHGLVRDC